MIECCQASGTTLNPRTYTLNCKDSYGDGWGGGYIKIGSTEYCKQFLSGHEESHTIKSNGQAATG